MRDYEEAVLKQARTCANRKYCDIGGNCEYYDLDVCCQGGEKDILKDAASAIEELLAAVPNWISVEERLPEVDERVLACVGIPGELSVWDGVRWNGEEWEAEEEAAYDYWTTIDDPVTHWMPLPAPPKEVQDG